MSDRPIPCASAHGYATEVEVALGVADRTARRRGRKTAAIVLAAELRRLRAVLVAIRDYGCPGGDGDPCCGDDRREIYALAVSAAVVADAEVEVDLTSAYMAGFERGRSAATGYLPLAEDCVLHFAFRYALGRTTAAPSMVAEQLSKNWPRLRESTRRQIHREIREALEGGDLGHNCDVATWRTVLALPAGDNKKAE